MLARGEKGRGIFLLALAWPPILIRGDCSVYWSIFDSLSWWNNLLLTSLYSCQLSFLNLALLSMICCSRDTWTLCKSFLGAPLSWSNSSYRHIFILQSMCPSICLTTDLTVAYNICVIYWLNLSSIDEKQSSIIYLGNSSPLSILVDLPLIFFFLSDLLNWLSSNDCIGLLYTMSFALSLSLI